MAARNNNNMNNNNGDEIAARLRALEELTRTIEAYERALSIERISKNEEDVMNRNMKREIGGSSYQNNFDKRPRYDHRGNNSSFGTNFHGNRGFKGGNNQARG
ncbi:Protein GET1 [Bienertia sinuspersici]